MSHPDPDQLVLIAFDDHTQDLSAGVAHLGVCSACRAEVDSMRLIAGLEREQVDELLTGRVWTRIASQTVEPPCTVVQPDTLLHTDVRPRRRPRARHLVPVVAAVAGAVATAAFTAPDAAPAPAVVAQVQLVSQPDAPAAASGAVEFTDTGHGVVARVRMSGMPSPAGLYEVWLYDGGTDMVPLGVLSGPSADLPVPAAVALRRFPVVDVSAQQFGQQEHGTSMLRGRVR